MPEAQLWSHQNHSGKHLKGSNFALFTSRLLGNGAQLCTPESSSSDLADTHILPISNSPLLLWGSWTVKGLQAPKLNSMVQLLLSGDKMSCSCLSHTSPELSEAELSKGIQRLWQANKL